MGLISPGAPAHETDAIHFLLHREFGHNFLPKLLGRKLSMQAESVHQQAYDVARKYVSHVTSAVKGLVQQLFLSA